MLLIFAYAPVLIILPILLVIAVLAVLVPGGFIVVLVGPYYLWCGFMWLLIRAARAPRAKRQRANVTSALASNPAGAATKGFPANPTARPLAVVQRTALRRAPG